MKTKSKTLKSLIHLCDLHYNNFGHFPRLEAHTLRFSYPWPIISITLSHKELLSFLTSKSFIKDES